MPENPWDLWNWLDTVSVSLEHIAVEKVGASPQMGVTSAFTFGKGYGTLVGQLTTLAHTNGISFEEVTPQDWQRTLYITPRKKKPKRKKAEKPDDYKRRIKGKKHETDGQFKKRLRAKAQQLFPKFGLWKQPRSIGRQLAVCDALLIAEYCRRTAK